MSWSEVFPILSDEQVEEYEVKVSARERRQYDEWFSVQRVVNPQNARHILSTSLFWKNIRLSQPQIVVKDRAMLMNAMKRDANALSERSRPARPWRQSLPRCPLWSTDRGSQSNLQNPSMKRGAKISHWPLRWKNWMPHTLT